MVGHLPFRRGDLQKRSGVTHNTHPLAHMERKEQADLPASKANADRAAVYNQGRSLGLDTKWSGQAPDLPAWGEIGISKKVAR